MLNLYGYTWEKMPPAEWFLEPPTEGQKSALRQNRDYREVNAKAWSAMQVYLLQKLDISSEKHNSKGAFSMLLDFWINATTSSKKSLETHAFALFYGQGELL
jgi:hypothetical protein